MNMTTQVKKSYQNLNSEGLEKNMKLFLPSGVKDYFSKNQDGYMWFLLTFVSALVLPIAIQLAITFVSKDTLQCSSIFIIESELLIFLMVIIYSLVIDDFIFEGKNPPYSRTRRLLFSFLPMVISVCCVSAYILTFFRRDDMGTLVFMVVVEIFMLIFTAFYAASVKQISFNSRVSPKSEVTR
jgi:hypothetical protein